MGLVSVTHERGQCARTLHGRVCACSTNKPLRVCLQTARPAVSKAPSGASPAPRPLPAALLTPCYRAAPLALLDTSPPAAAAAGGGGSGGGGSGMSMAGPVCFGVGQWPAPGGQQRAHCILKHCRSICVGARLATAATNAGHSPAERPALGMLLAWGLGCNKLHSAWPQHACMQQLPAAHSHTGPSQQPAPLSHSLKQRTPRHSCASAGVLAGCRGQGRSSSLQLTLPLAGSILWRQRAASFGLLDKQRCQLGCEQGGSG